MKNLLCLGFLFLLSIPTSTFSQLPDGSIAPDWTLTDINGNTHHLYDLLDQGKMVVLEFSATWCGPCWNYMLTGALESFWNQYGPNGTNQAQVFYIESDFSTGMADLLGQTPSSQGNWVAAIPFPIIDLQPGQNTANDYDINYYPTLFAVCADHTLWEVGQVSASKWGEFVTSCTLNPVVSDIQEALCYGSGSVTLQTTGGISPITYNWSNGDHGPTLDNVGAGTYDVTVTEHNGKFVVLEDIVVPGQDAPISLASSEIEDVLCHGQPTGSVLISLAEGTPPFSYDWSNGSHAQNLINVIANEYTVNATDSHGCVFEASFEITEPDAITVDYAFTPDYCDQSNGTISLDIDGGVGGYDIEASSGSVFGTTILDIPAGSVNVQVEDDNGCLWLHDFQIVAEAEPDVYFTPSPLISCVQPMTVVTGYVSSGSGDFDFYWTTTNGHIVGPADQAAITVDAPGNYMLQVDDIITGCSVQNEVAVASQIDPPYTSAGDDAPVSCENLQLTLAGSGDPAYSISWTTLNGHIVSGENTYTPVVDAPGEYTLTVVNPENSCANSDEVTVINEIQPAQSAYQYQTSALTMIGNNVSTGSNVAGWSWTFGDGGTASEPNVIHTFAAPGTYEVCLNVENGCGASQSCQMVEVSFNGGVISVDAVITDVSCFSGSNGNIIPTINGGSGNYSYQWSGPNETMYSTPTLEGVVAGTYQLVVTDDTGNIFIGEFHINEPPQLVVVGSMIVDNICFGDTQGALTVDIAGGVSPFIYSFNDGPAQSENFILNQANGEFICQVTDANGCMYSAGPFLITSPAEITYQAVLTTVRCFGETNGAIDLQLAGGNSPYTYLWTPGENSGPALTQLAAGAYSCLVTDQNGCAKNIMIEVTQPDVLEATNIQVTDAWDVQQTNGTISLVPTGGTAPYVVSWSNGATGNKIEGLVPGQYTYLITDANGCTFAPSGPVTVGSAVATAPVEWTTSISISPNPSDGKVLVTWRDLPMGDGIITLLTLEGKKLTSRKTEAESGQWDLSPIGLNNGMYILLFRINEEMVPFKLIVVN